MSKKIGKTYLEFYLPSLAGGPMKISLQRDSLLKPLQTVIGVVERKQTLPILSNVLIDIKNNKVSITGTDLEVELIGNTNLDTKEQDSILTLPGRKLMDICRALPEGALVELVREKEKVTLISGKSRFTLSTLPAVDFPNVEIQESQIQFQVPQSVLKRLLQRTYFAMAQEDVRYYLNGLLLECDTNRLRVVATDGHRLALNALPVTTGAAQRTQVIVPRKGVIELMRMLVDDDQTAQVSIGSNFIQVVTASFVFTSKLIDGRFPDYERVIPKAKAETVTVGKEILKQALIRTAILCNEKFKGVRFEFKDKLLKIISNNPEQETAEEEIAIDYSGPSFDIGFNVVYFLDVLNTIYEKDIKLTISDPSSSVLIEDNVGDNTSVFVVMPMRL